MEVPTIPKTGIDQFVIENINDYVNSLIKIIVKYGNSIPYGPRAEYLEQITNNFQMWYNRYPEVHSIDCVKNALDMCKNIPCIQEE